MSCASLTQPSGSRNTIQTPPRLLPPPVVARHADGQVHHPVAIDVAGRAHAAAEARPGLEPGNVVDVDPLLALHRAIGIQEEHPHGADAVALPVGDGEVGDAVVVEVAELGQTLAPLGTGGHLAEEATLGLTDLLLALHGAVGVQEENPDRAGVAAAVVVAARRHREVAPPRRRRPSPR